MNVVEATNALFMKFLREMALDGDWERVFVISCFM